jgi:UDP-N-acetylmuramoyl-L-alanyl-D-glutamate--2,6-diaminopimelate ligase
VLLKKILSGIDADIPERSADIEIDRVTDDSRAAGRGSLFIAVKGCARDGAKYINDAIARGAAAIISQEDFPNKKNVVKMLVSDSRDALSRAAANIYGRPSDALKTVGITGTNGKTTITYIIESIIRRAGFRAGVIGTINHRIHDKILPSGNTTPGALELQSMLSDMIKARCGYAVMEVSSHALDQGRVDGVSFDVGIFTNITRDHLDYHKDISSYFNAKKKLLRRIKKGGVVLINADDKKVASIAIPAGCGVMTYAVKNRADIQAKDVMLSLDNTRFAVRTPDDSFTIKSALIGAHNVSNILSSIGAGIALGLDRNSIIRGIETVESVPGRLEAVNGGQKFKVFVDYAHTEDALKNVLGLLKEVAERDIITVFGCGGNRDRSKRPLMGRAACASSNNVIITSDNPRNEDPMAIIEEIESGIKGVYSNYRIVPDRRKAIEEALAMASKGDIVLIAGKGHEDYQIIGEKKSRFDDKEVVRDILGKDIGSRVTGCGTTV